MSFLKEKHVRVKDSGLPIFSIFLSSFLLIYYFSFLYFGELRIRVPMTSLSQTSHMTKVTVICHMERHRRFWKDDVRLYVDLKANT